MSLNQGGRIGVTILGPTWWHAGGKFVLGADGNGRDVAVRLLYGGRNSLKVGIGSALICTLLSIILALLAGYYGGWGDLVDLAVLRPHLGLPRDPARDRAGVRARNQRPPLGADQHREQAASGSRRSLSRTC